MFQAILEVKKDLKNQDEIFSYPSIPLPYLLLKKNFVGTPVLWFDVAGLNDGDLTVSELEKKKPKYIFWLKPPKEVYEGHFNLRKKDPSVLEVDNWLIDSVLNNKYRVIKAIETFNKDKYLTSTKTQLKLSSRMNTKYLKNLCEKIYKCIVQSGTAEFIGEIESGLAATNFIENTNSVFEFPRFVFYVLKRVN